jgi:hypothetical protein
LENALGVFRKNSSFFGTGSLVQFIIVSYYSPVYNKAEKEEA